MSNNQEAQRQMNIAFFNVGADTSLANFLCRSAKKFNSGARLVQLTDEKSPPVEESDDVVRFDGSAEEMMFFRTYCFSKMKIKGPTWYLDTDMLVLEQLPTFEDIGLCVREFHTNTIFNHAFKGMDMSSHKGRSLGEVYPILGCALFTPGDNFWEEIYNIYQSLPHKYRRWYGDQEALRIYSESRKFIKLMENKYACLPEFLNPLSHTKIIHYKGGARKLLMLEYAKKMGFN